MADRAPTTKELADNIMASFEANYGQEIPIFKKAFLRVISKVLGGILVVLYKYAGFLGLQMFVSTASASETEINGTKVVPLVEISTQFGVSRPELAKAAELEIEITVTNQSGFIDSGTPLISSLNGVTYITVGSIELNAATVLGDVIAVSDQSGGDGKGIIGNLDVGDIMSFINPLSNVNQDAEVTQTLVQGAEGEVLDTEYRSRSQSYRRNPPQGGALADYVIWGLEVNGIINIYPYTGRPGEVDIYSEATPQSSGSSDGIPTQAQLGEVNDSIQYDTSTGIAQRRPVGSFVNSLPITRIGFDVTVFGLIVDDIAKVKSNIEAALTDYFLSLEPFVVGISVLPRKDRVTATAAGGVVDEVVSEAGGIFEGIELFLSGTPIKVFSLGEGRKCKLLVVTYT